MLQVLESKEGELADRISEEYRTKMKRGLRAWVDAGNAGNLAWGIMHARA